MGELLLTVDTSSAAASVALSRGEVLLGEILLNLPGARSDRLLLTVSRLLEETGVGIGDLDGLGVIVGPGAFTGLRVGVATVKGLALATGKPAVGVSSLRALAMQTTPSPSVVCPLLDARKQEVYAGLFRWEGSFPVAVAPERVAPPASFLEELEGEIVFIGAGSEVYRTTIVERLGARARFAPWPSIPLRASSAAALVLNEIRNGRTGDLAQLNPVYIRPSEAEIAWVARGGESLIEG